MIDINKMVKIVCIKGNTGICYTKALYLKYVGISNIKDVKDTPLYTYFNNGWQPVIEVFNKINNEYCSAGVHSSCNYITLAEFREQRINSILND